MKEVIGRDALYSLYLHLIFIFHFIPNECVLFLKNNIPWWEWNCNKKTLVVRVKVFNTVNLLYCMGTIYIDLTWRKLNELSENVSFNSEFDLAFEIQLFKVACFIFLNANFLKYSRAEWVNVLLQDC